MKTLTSKQTAEIKALFEKWAKLEEETRFLDHNEKKGKKAACTRTYYKLRRLISTMTDENPDNVIYRLINA